MSVNSSKHVKIFWKFYGVFVYYVNIFSENFMYLHICFRVTPKAKIDFVEIKIRILTL